MRVHIYKSDSGELSVFVAPSRGARKPPVLVRGVTAENVRARVTPIICKMRGEPLEPAPSGS